jgi:hypothetical protein
LGQRGRNSNQFKIRFPFLLHVQRLAVSSARVRDTGGHFVSFIIKSIFQATLPHGGRDTPHSQLMAS